MNISTFPGPRVTLLLVVSLMLMFTTSICAVAAASSHPIDNLVPGHWYEVPNSHLSQVLPSPIPPGTSASYIVAAWNGGAYDTKRDHLLVWGGGHQGYAGNEIYAFDINTLTWSRVWDPTPNDQIPSGDHFEIYNDGNPASRHTYNGLQYIPATDELWLQGGGTWQMGFGSIATWVFRFSTGSWVRVGDVRATSKSGIGVSSAYDPVTGNVYHQGMLDLSEYDPYTGNYTIQAQLNSGWWESGMTAAIDPQKRLFVAVGQGHTRVWDLDTWAFTREQVTSGGDAIVNAAAPGFVYDSATSQFVAWAGSGVDSALGDLYVLNTDTWVWQKVSPAATNAVLPTTGAVNGTYGRFRYIPSKNAFIVVNSIYENVFVYKMDSGTAPPPTTLTAHVSADKTVGLAPLAVQFSVLVEGGGTPMGYTWDFNDGTTSVQQNPLHTFSTPGIYTTTVTVTDDLGNTDSANIEIRAQDQPSNVIQVGPGRLYQTPSEAAAAVSDGATIEIDAGTYFGDVAVWLADDLTIRGVGGRAHIQADPADDWLAEGKGIWVVRGTNTTVENIELSGAAVRDLNGAGIRQEGAGLTVRNCYFHGNQNGILGGAGHVLVEYSEFGHNGHGDGQSHNIYIGHSTSRFTLQHSYSHHAKIGHNVKSRAKENYILYNRIMDESDGTSSFAVDLPVGGPSYLVGNLIQQGPSTSNSSIISYAGEGTSNTGQELYLANNSLVNDRGSGNFVRVNGTPVVKLVNNIFAGTGTLIYGGTAEETNNLAGTSSLFVDAVNFDYHPVEGSLAVDGGTVPGTVNGFDLTPVFQYVHPSDREPRAAVGTIDIGAYELPASMPTIAAQPQDLAVREGDTATFTVAVTGVPTPDIQWQKDGTDIPGATGVSYTTQPVTALDNGSQYRAVVSNTEGTVTSNPATLKVQSPALTSIVVSPSAATILPTATLQFSAVGIDQFGNPFAITPSWSISGGGVISSTGLLTAGASEGGPFTVTAADAGIQATAEITISASAILVDFGGTVAESSFGIPGWDIVLKDVYTDYRSSGPGGTTIVIGDNYNYNYQGVTGPAQDFVSGQKIVVTWYNSSSNPITFIPRVSFDDPDRKISGAVGTWHDMTEVTVPPLAVADSEFTIDDTTAGTYSLVNVNNNYRNNQVLFCDKVAMTLTASAPSIPLGQPGQPVHYDD